MKIKTQYTGMTSTPRYLTIHFKMSLGDSIVRASQVKIRVDDLNSEVMLEAVDRQARRKLMETWSGQDIIPWDIADDDE
uniref:Uncharacterized protein n=1 Tax=uncultured prokaryote TaxID=198431 RepID=A0A0H5Q449_9ZZZZ|nr:hypothetical protein [uncultured prokaryote]